MQKAGREGPCAVRAPTAYATDEAIDETARFRSRGRSRMPPLEYERPSEAPAWLQRLASYFSLHVVRFHQHAADLRQTLRFHHRAMRACVRRCASHGGHDVWALWGFCTASGAALSAAHGGSTYFLGCGTHLFIALPTK